MPRGIPNQPRKNAAKKAAKKTTKRTAKVVKKVAKKAPAKRAPRQPKAEAPIVDTVTDAAAPSPEPTNGERTMRDFGEALHQAFSEQARGAFSASGMLDMRVMDRVAQARGNVVGTVRGLVDAGIALNAGANASVSERDVLLARQNLAVAEFELAMDELERTIRG